MMMPLSVSLALAACTMMATKSRRRSSVSGTNYSSPPGIAELSAAPARFVRVPALLGPQRAADILYSTALHSPDFAPSTVTGGIADYRKSQVLWSADQIAPDIVARIQSLTPELTRILRIAPFQPSMIESQVTVSGDGDYFKQHTDNGSPETATRRLSWVYYTHLEPCPFVGGELVIYDGQTGGAYIVEPECDSLVVFPSECLHEVREVTAASRAALDSRVTVNGWVRAA